MAIRMFLYQVLTIISIKDCVIAILPDTAGSSTCFPDSDFHYYYSRWNKTTSPSVFQKSFCSIRCRDGERVKLRDVNICEEVECIDCSCKRPECQYYGICCPDISEDYTPPVEFENDITPIEDFFGILRDSNGTAVSINKYSQSLPYNYSNNVVGFPNLGCEKLAFNSSFLYITSCFKDFTGNAEIVRQCEERIQASEITVDNYAWVIDNATSVVYRNIYCAVCNRAIMPQQLPVHTLCTNYMSIYQLTSQDELLRAALKQKSCCRVERKPPSREFTFSCNQYFYSSKPVSSCDSAPPEWGYDDDIVKACHELNDTIYTVKSIATKSTYKNLFCALCNLKTMPAYYYNCTCVLDYSVVVQLPFSLLINFGRSSTVESIVPRKKTPFTYASCSTKVWQSPDDRCIDLICSPGKLLSNRSCRTVFANTAGLHYSMRFLLYTKASEDNPPWEDYDLRYPSLLNNLTSQIRDMLINISYAQSIRMGYIITNVTESSERNASKENNFLLWVETKLIAFRDVQRDTYEQLLIERFIEDGVNMKYNDGLSLKLAALLTPLIFSTEEYIEIIGRNKSFLIGQELKWVSSKYKVKKCFVDLTKSVTFTGVLLCSYISFSPSHYNITMDYTMLPPVITVAIDLNITQVNISTTFELNMIEVGENGNLHVCHKVLDAKLNDIETVYRMSKIKYRLSDTNLAQYIVTMTSLGCSMIFLFLTIFTYFLFRALRNPAGKNNIFLSLSLLLAQASLIVGAHRPSSDFICKLTGVMIHFLWLWVFSWTFICSFQMFRVFTASTRNQLRSERDRNKQLVKRVTCSLIGPTAVVVSVIVGSLRSTDYEDIGYGRNVCYLDSTVLTGISMILPMAVCTVSNTIFYTITIVTICKIRELQATSSIKKDYQRQMYIYAKMSSVTGAFWTIAIVAEAADVDTLRFISIILNGFQGVFIFLSFICNKRVLKMYMLTLSPSKSHGEHTPTTAINYVVTHSSEQ